MVVDRVWVLLGVGPVGGCRGDEAGAACAEEVLEDGDGFWPTALEASELFAVAFAQAGVDGVVEFGGDEGYADGDQAEHLVVHFGDAVVGGGVFLLEVPRPGDVDEDVAEHADGVGVAAEHQVAEADVVVCCEVGGEDTREGCLFAEFDVVEGFEREGEISEEAVHAEKADDGEVA